MFDRIRAARPSRLYIGVDGLKGEHRRAGWEEVRSLADEVDWECTVRTRYLEANVGPGAAVGGAIDWFFQHEEDGIILEEDCLPDPTFFPYCAAALDHYRQDPGVMLVSGSNLCWQMLPHPACRFTTHALPWGWASWRRAWQQHDPATLAPIDDWGDPGLRDWLGSAAALRLWQYRQKANTKGWVDTWDFGWQLSIIRARGLCLLPAVNLIDNIGCGEDSTHTSTRESLVDAVPARAHPLPVEFPTVMAADPELEQWNLWQILGHHPAQDETAADVTRDIAACRQPAKDLRKAARDLARLARMLPANPRTHDVRAAAESCAALAEKSGAAAACLEGIVATRQLHTSQAAAGKFLHAAISFSGDGEDRILQRQFHGLSHGFYVDCPAVHPIHHSTTWGFYLQGWRGINVGAAATNMDAFHIWRPRDINLTRAMTAGLPLGKILGAHLPRGTTIDFMNLSGGAAVVEMLAGLDWPAHRPRVVACRRGTTGDLAMAAGDPLVAWLLGHGFRLFAATFDTFLLSSD